MKTTTIAILALAGSALLGTGVAHAAGADLAVKGKLQPGACNVTLANEGKVELGSLRGSSLNTDHPTSVGVRSMAVSVGCGVPIRFSLQLVENRPNTHFGGLLGGQPEERGRGYGLGLSGGQKIGEYAVSLREAKGDGEALRLVEHDSRNGWSGSSNWTFRSSSRYSFAKAANAADHEPVPLTALSTSVDLRAYINKASELDLRQEIQIDGSATLDLVYL